MEEVEDYLEKIDKDKTLFTKAVEFKQSKHFAYPLEKQNSLKEHDPVAFITGAMTKLKDQELIAFQIVLSKTYPIEAYKIHKKILNNEDVLSYLNRLNFPVYLKPFIGVGKALIKAIQVVGNQLQWMITELATNGQGKPVYAGNFNQYQQQLKLTHARPARVLSSFEEETIKGIEEKVTQQLFETSIRALIVSKDKTSGKERIDGVKSYFSPFSTPQYQSIKIKYNILPYISKQIKLFLFKNRLLSLSNKSDYIFSVSEIADLYHFPYSKITQTENIVKSYSKELPAPLSLKQGRKLDVVFGKNTYGGQVTDIGLTEEERKTHTYIIGRTGSGKTTLMFSMAKHDIEQGRGLAFIDPHGDVAEDLLSCVPLSRKDDLIYVNPRDLKHPIGINILELTDGLDEDEKEMEKEVVCEGVISLFKKVFSKDENANAHRIEHILRNTIYTAFYVEDRTLFTINKLLTNSAFRKQVLSKVDDEDLLDFWKAEFGKAGDWQIVKMTQGVTAKVGRFLRSPTARRMLEQTKSTINFDEVLNGKILICNLSQGKLGEDTTKLIGTTILTKLQQAALKRSNVPQSQRKPFYLYIDEFQNFATLSFIKIISEGRKYALHLIIAEQSTSQQMDNSIVNQILANVTTVIVFRSANYLDEELMLDQFSPYLQKGEIPSLPRYRFYIKISALESEEPFSGETIYFPVEKDEKRMEELIEASRKNYAIVYTKPVKSNDKKTAVNEKENEQSNDKNDQKKTGLPKLKRG
ncbi:MAG: type IV secretion system DNA-binding domain-containing protein [Actinobacteria bacterium]|nr:type IV secretion system DNA-binding domain-containing protein [Actinomycetota bacterium]